MTDSPHRSAAAVFVLLALMVVAGLGGAAQAVAQGGTAADPTRALLRYEDRQARLGRAAGESAGEVAALADEFARNGLGGADAAVFDAVRSALASLAEELMPSIAADLATAGSAADDPAARLRHALSAHAGQKTAASRLRQIVATCRRQMEVAHLADQVRRLGDRQSTNLHDGAMLALARKNPNAADRTLEFDISLQLQTSEQRSLRNEVTLVLDALEAFGSVEGSLFERRPREALALAASRRLHETAAAAAAELEEGRLSRSIDHQRSVRDTLWRLASLLGPERDPVARLLEALDQLDALVAAEETLVAATRALADREDVPGWREAMATRPIRRLRELIANLEGRLAAETGDEEEEIGRLRSRIDDLHTELARAIETAMADFGLPAPDVHQQRREEQVQRDQAELADHTDFLRGEIEPLAPDAARHLAEAVASMRDARVARGTDKPVDLRVAEAAASGIRALASLADAREALAAAIEAARSEQPRSADDPDRLEPLTEEILGQLELPIEDAVAATAGAQGETAEPPPAAGPTQGEGTTPGEGRGQGEGRARGVGSGQGRGQGDLGNWNGTGGADGPRRRREDSGRHIGLPDREGGAVRQSGASPASPEFDALIEQYLRNLSEAASHP